MVDLPDIATEKYTLFRRERGTRKRCCCVESETYGKESDWTISNA
jgi:hypothetical protein